jgi:hypothetical protein
VAAASRRNKSGKRDFDLAADAGAGRAGEVSGSRPVLFSTTARPLGSFITSKDDDAKIVEPDQPASRPGAVVFHDFRRSFRSGCRG